MHKETYCKYTHPEPISTEPHVESSDPVVMKYYKWPRFDSKAKELVKLLDKDSLDTQDWIDLQYLFDLYIQQTVYLMHSPNTGDLKKKRLNNEELYMKLEYWYKGDIIEDSIDRELDNYNALAIELDKKEKTHVKKPINTKVSRSAEWQANERAAFKLHLDQVLGECIMQISTKCLPDTQVWLQFPDDNVVVQVNGIQYTYSRARTFKSLSFKDKLREILVPLCPDAWIQIYPGIKKHSFSLRVKLTGA